MGKKIRAIRTAKDMKITEMARLSGLTTSMISQMERGLISPSIETLKKIGNVLDVPLSFLFETEGERGAPVTDFNTQPTVQLFGASPVVHASARKKLSPGDGIELQLLNPNLNGPIEFIYNIYQPHSGTGREKYSHPGNECGLVLTGELVVEIEDETYVLRAGDSITFDSTKPHAKRNLSDQVCTCVWANVPPWF
ncbi:MAG: cupin domain-containing protein [Butyricicoccus sp.]|nr:cupin domain-containing protein [Butyricicoccus sp.]